MSSTAITLTYTLASPPLKADAPQIPASQTFTYPISASGVYQTTYASTSDAVLQAQRDLNEALTAWKDAIGDAEKAKEDLGKIEYGKGKAARMMQYAAGREGAEVDADEDDEDGPGDAE